MYKFTHVDGKDAGKLTLYALSTCIWCRKTRALLDELKLAYDYVYVDLLNSEDGDKAEEDMSKWNPKKNFPTMIVNDKDAIIGFQEEAIRKLAK